MTNRRQFLKTGIASSIGASSLLGGGLFSEVAKGAISVNDHKSLVCIYLDGGNDSFNMLIPNTVAEHAAYKRSRQNLGFDRTDLQKISPRGLGTDSFGFNPNMPELKDLFNNGELSCLANVGSLIRTTSKADILNETADLPTGLGAHNFQGSYWKADHNNTNQTSQDGFGGRLANEFINNSLLPPVISAGSGFDLFLLHSVLRFYDLGSEGLNRMPDFNLSDTSVTGYNTPSRIARRKALDMINQMAGNDKNLLVQHSANTFADGLELNVRLQNLIQSIPPLSQKFPRSNLGRGLKSIAELISIREELAMNRQVFFVRMAGFDMHADQAEPHLKAMEQLSQALAAFNSALKDIGAESSVLTYTASEFARTLTSNRDGTDHAWGGNHILMGGGIKGGEIFGSYPALELGGDEDYNGDGRFIPSTSITQMGATIAKWFGVPQSRLGAILPNLSNFSGREDLGFFRT